MKTLLLSVALSLSMFAADAPKPKEPPKISDAQARKLWRTQADLAMIDAQIAALKDQRLTAVAASSAAVSELAKFCSDGGAGLVKDGKGEPSCEFAESPAPPAAAPQAPPAPPQSVTIPRRNK